jgi:formylglycine-generating enzyme required for sulfatase activity/cephalosporin-C deacetylase-like acetyl esterase
MMLPEPSKEKAVFHAALSLTDSAMRADYLSVACRDDGALRQRIESLLRAAEDGDSTFMRMQALGAIEVEAGNQAVDSSIRRRVETFATTSETSVAGKATPFHESAAETIPADAESDPLLDRTLGHYRVVSLIDAGGMGRVYLAEDPRLGRKVALKTIEADPMGEGRARYLREARLASALDHPNICAIHDVGESSGVCFIAMQYVQGQTLKQLINDRPVALDTLVSIALEVADALAAAHRRGIIHRDIKPSNIMVDSRRQVKVLDFGVAKLQMPSPRASDSEHVAGTPAYMSPEQARGEPVDDRSDIFSFGAVLYQMATGSVPFAGASSREVMRDVIEKPHRQPRQLNPQTPPELVTIINRALAKAPQDRYHSVEEMAADLRELAAKVSLPTHPALVSARRHRRGMIAGLAAMAITVLVSWRAWQAAHRTWALKQIPVVESLVRDGRTFEAHDLTVRALRYVPGEPKLMRLMPVISDTLTITSEPAGAHVYLKRFANEPALAAATPKTLVGTTPLRDFRLARCDYVLRVEKEGYVPFQRTLSGAVVRDFEELFAPSTMDVKLVRTGEAPPGMVFVPGGECQLTAWERPTDRKVELRGYWIDQCEVTNSDYQQFVDGGGYASKRYWPEFTRDGESLSWEQALRDLKDTTGSSGPRGWAHGKFPDGKAHHPVTGITWYEAAAYAKFRGKSLPTIFQWERAAKYQWKRTGTWNPIGVTLPWGLFQGSTLGRANFNSSGTLTVGSLEFGLSPYGCYDMAGNVSEWCLNETSEGFLTVGGSWNQPATLFGLYGRYRSWFSSDQLGFRCVLNVAHDESDGFIDIDRKIVTYAPEPEDKARDWLAAYYEYDRTALHARVAERQESDNWHRETIEFTGANNERTFAYLYLPKNASPPYRVVHIIPAGDVRVLKRPLAESLEGEYRDLICTGRAVFAVVLNGFAERPERETAELDPDTTGYVEDKARHIIDLRRGLDCLFERDDVDASRLAFLAGSAGGIIMTLPAIDTRYKAVVLWGAGIRKGDTQKHPAASPITFAPLIRQPTLQIHGRYDEATPFSTEAQALFDLLTCEKKLLPFEGGHRPDPTYLAREVDAWLDHALGPSAR